ncbi:GGDEF-domain containing protein [Trinickia symbiotica]|uniref:GGDEF-domain containing protein n=1 Tax=Trinickia symbiotica TaxID=863227 RepID=A0A2T3XKM4_9BURK|nr:EAL domain-containing protein [Trinickia symbiotica]PTB16997.1 GGDEF-domain containing protein [Trinickia symbiotica]
MVVEKSRKSPGRFKIRRCCFRLQPPATCIAWIPTGTLLLVLGIWLAALTRIQTEGREARTAVASATSQVASSFAAHIDKTVHDADVIVGWVKYEYERSPSTFNIDTLKDKALVSADTALQVTIVGPSGEVLQTTTPDAQPVDLSDRPHFIAHKTNANLGLYISLPVLGRISHHWSLQFTRRLNNPDGSFAGVVVVSEDPTFLTTGFYNLDALGVGGMLAVLSDSGNLLSRLAAGELASPVEAPAPEYRDMLDVKGGVFADPIDRMRRFVTYRHSARYPVAVLVGMSEDDALAGYWHARNLYLLLAGGLTVVLLTAAAFITVTMARLAAARAKMQHLAETDALTGLPNRYLLTESLRQCIEREKPFGQLALVFVDLDNFKRINDALGHQTGDELLQNVARRLARVAGAESFLARVGGDEFVLVIKGARALAAAQSLASSIIDAFEIAFGLRGNSYVMRASIGIAVYDADTEAEYDLLRRADLAMYAAKEEGKPANLSRYRVYAPDLSTRAMRDIERQQELQYAIQNNEFFLEYQPIVSLTTGETQGLEALVRWRHPEKGVIPPVDFVPFAERTGFIVPIGELILEAACAQFSEWLESEPGPLYLSVNVSAVQLIHGDLVTVVRRCLDQHGIDPRRLKLEITETTLLDGSAAVERSLKTLRLLGVRVVLDDFGTGYSSLSQLTSLTVDGVKIDRSFTRGIPDDRAALAMVENVISLARDLGLTLVIEGVEGEQQVNWLRRFGDIEVQGFYFGRPVAPTTIRVGRAA